MNEAKKEEMRRVTAYLEEDTWQKMTEAMRLVGEDDASSFIDLAVAQWARELIETNRRAERKEAEAKKANGKRNR